MPRATRVQLAPPEPWDEDRLLDAARHLELPEQALKVGDDVNGLVIEAIEPAGAQPDADTSFDLLPYTPREGAGLHLMVLLDCGASMRAPWGNGLTRSDAARYALGTFADQAPAWVASVTLFTYNRELARLAGPIAPRDLARPARADAEPTGPSRLAGAIDLVLRRIAVQRGRRLAILVLTDTASDSDALPGAAERAKRLGVPVHALSFAPEDDEEVRKLTAATGGAYDLAETPPTLAGIVDALAKRLGRPRTWAEPSFPRPGEPGHDTLIEKQAPRDALARLGLRKEKTE